jgi:hypothetical protein
MLLEAGGLDAELYRLGHTKVCTPIQPTPECDDFFMIHSMPPRLWSMHVNRLD